MCSVHFLVRGSDIVPKRDSGMNSDVSSSNLGRQELQTELSK
jgi:hypothetical protein